MNRLEAALLRAATELQQLRTGWALIGGIAVSTRAEPRTTRDVDIVVLAEDDKAAEKVVWSLKQQGYRIREDGVLDQVATGRLATTRLESPSETDGGVVVDLMFASSGIEEEVVRSAERIEVLPGTVLPVATLAHLLALKTLAGRPQDLVDIGHLLAAANDGDIEQAKDALDLISRRGFDRGKDLLVDFEKYRSGRFGRAGE